MKNNRKHYLTSALTLLCLMGSTSALSSCNKNAQLQFVDFINYDKGEKYYTRDSQLAFMTQGMKNASDFEKVLRIHDWMCTSYHYRINPDNTYEVIPSNVYKDHYGQCMSLSATFMDACLSVGVDCITVSNVSEMHHMWNMVKVDGSWYHMDVTWDIGDSTYNPFPTVSHTYFLKSDDFVSSEEIDYISRHYNWIYDDSYANNEVNQYFSPDYALFHYPVDTLPTSSSNKYDNMFWNQDDVASQVILHENNYYYIREISDEYYVCSNDLQGKNENQLYKIEDKWPSSTPGYTLYGHNSGLGIYNNKLYLNNSTEIYTLDLDGQNKEIVKTCQEGYNYYGLAIANDTLIYVANLAGTGKYGENKIIN